ncbi:hypothetical protein A3K63_05470 [Candidatus Micrarchaeota archaeon RBG_16_49_10]|nr:MAG: hypothetical protein A3K63_05470 [Candidatus Micrarchaeota archaeon RBG_16_49_10]
MNFSYGFRFFGSIIFTAILIVLATGYWESPWNNFLGMVVYLLGFAVWFMGNNRIGESFSFKPMAKKLVTEGIYSKIRHPMYTGASIMLLGISIFLASIPLCLVALLAVMIFAYRARLEEKALRKKFRDKYLRYRRKTWF